MKQKIYSFILDFFQVSSILILITATPIMTANIVFTSLQIMALVMIVLAAWEMKRTRYYRVPDIGRQNELVTTGIYQFIRNPMYFSELLFVGVLVLNVPTFFRIVVFFILFVGLILKIHYEEQLLQKYFKDKFIQYKKTSWRLLPFIY